MEVLLMLAELGSFQPEQGLLHLMFTGVLIFPIATRIAASQGGSNEERRAELLHGATMVAKAKEGFSSAGDVVGVIIIHFMR